ncbi:MAG: tetratricopeptide repeat protein, partial [Bacteroidota bacterium]
PRHTYVNLADCHLDLSDDKMALSYAQKAHILARENGPNGQPALAESFFLLGNIYVRLGQYEVAISNLKEALRQYQGLFGIDHPKVFELNFVIAKAYAKWGQPELANQYFGVAE